MSFSLLDMPKSTRSLLNQVGQAKENMPQRPNKAQEIGRKSKTAAPRHYHASGYLKYKPVGNKWWELNQMVYAGAATVIRCSKAGQKQSPMRISSRNLLNARKRRSMGN